MTFKLYGYQVETLRQINDAIESGEKEIILAAGVGAGKTQMAMALMRERGTSSFLVLTHGQEVLRDMWMEEFGKHSMRVSASPGKERITVNIPQSLHRSRIKKVDFVVIDEAHQFTSSAQSLVHRSWRKGLTGHPDCGREAVAANNAARNSRPVACIDTGVRYPSVTVAAKSTGVSRNAIHSAITRGTHCGGYTWRYATKAENKAHEKKSKSRQKTCPRPNLGRAGRVGRIN